MCTLEDCTTLKIQTLFLYEGASLVLSSQSKRILFYYNIIFWIKVKMLPAHSSNCECCRSWCLINNQHWMFQLSFSCPKIIIYTVKVITFEQMNVHIQMSCFLMLLSCRAESVPFHNNVLFYTVYLLSWLVADQTVKFENTK